MRTLLLLIVSLAVLSGCDNRIGIGGASQDSKESAAEVENYQRYISPKLSETLSRNQCRGPSTDWSQHFEDIFRSFKFSLKRVDEYPVAIEKYGLTVSFQNREFRVLKNDGIKIREVLPSVFTMHPIWLGIDQLEGVPIMMTANRSRASTGRYFLAIYTLDGELLYRNVLMGRDVWNIDRHANGIDILGCGETRRITMR
jgi:hypothetical protein